MQKSKLVYMICTHVVLILNAKQTLGNKMNISISPFSDNVAKNLMSILKSVVVLKRFLNEEHVKTRHQIIKTGSH